jgi:hypothetical protein
MRGAVGITFDGGGGCLRLDLLAWSVYDNTSSERKAVVVRGGFLQHENV